LVYEFVSEGREGKKEPDNKKDSANHPTGLNRDATYSEQLKKRVVVVDDDPLVRSTFENIVKRLGFEILASMRDGQEIVDSIDGMKTKPDVIILDERMPRLTGIETAKIIHSKYPEISIVFVSADETARKGAKEAGAGIFLKKPITVGDLNFALNSA
jgi:two-component system, response regulator, stage 0 sporulation protein F